MEHNPNANHQKKCDLLETISHLISIQIESANGWLG